MAVLGSMLLSSSVQLLTAYQKQQVRVVTRFLTSACSAVSDVIVVTASTESDSLMWMLVLIGVLYEL